MSSNSSNHAARSPLLLGGAVTLLLLAGIVAASLHQRQVEREELLASFRVAARDRVAAIESRFHENAEHLEYVESFFHSSVNVERGEFHTFVAKVLADHQEILALGWAPRIPPEGIAELERQAQADGLSEYQVHDVGPHGRPGPCEPRQDYFPALYVESLRSGDVALGLDLGSSPLVRRVIDAATRAPEASDTAPIGTFGYAPRCLLRLAQPVFRPRKEAHGSPTLQGIAWLSIDLGALVKGAVARLSPCGVSFDGRVDGEAETAFYHRSRFAATDDPDRPIDFVEESTFTVAGQRWVVRSWPVRAWYAGRPAPLWKALLVSGVALCLFLALSLWAAARRSGLVRRLVQQRTAELTRLIDILEGTPDIVGIASLDGKAIYLNGPGRRQLGVPDGEDIRGQDISRYHPAWAYGIIVSQQVPALLRDGVWKGEYAVLARDGHEIPVSAIATLHGDEKGVPSCFSAIMRDISEKKRIQEETIADYNRRLEAAMKDLQRAQEAVRLHERLNALGQMASGIAHDVNNALAPVVGFADILLTDPSALADRERTIAHLNTIRTAAKDAAGVVRRLKEFYRNREETQPLVRVDLNRVVQETVLMTQPRWKIEAQAAGVAIQVTSDLGERTEIAGNEAELKEALTNLILNAVDALPQGGTIRVSTERRHDRVWLTVADTGVGMGHDTRRRCLEPFFTTKGEAGTGMGLAMVYAIVCRHEGKIEIESERGRGSKFLLVFPPYCTSPEAAPQVPSEAAGARPLRVLVVDDEPMIREVLKSYLQLDGHTVQTAADGEQALGLYRAGAFDLVLTDSAMPGLRGEDLAREVRRIRPDQRIALLTGFGDLMRAADKRPEEIDMVLPKPISIEELRTAVGKLAAR